MRGKKTADETQNSKNFFNDSVGDTAQSEEHYEYQTADVKPINTFHQAPTTPISSCRLVEYLNAVSFEI